MPAAIYALATMDTKADELCYVAERIRAQGLTVVMVDLSTRGSSNLADIPATTVAAAHPDGASAVLNQSDRGQAVTAMAAALRHWLQAEYDKEKVAGVIALGGSGGTAIVAPAFQQLPIGLPKLIVSTVASGYTQPYVGQSDITMMYSVVDVAGINSVSQRVLSNAAHALAGMVAQTQIFTDDKLAIGMTMFGVTTPCVDMVRQKLADDGYDPLVFHATGTGGRAMEKLVADGLISAVLDITTTEVADQVVGGVMPAGPARFDAILESKIPYVVSLGALDIVNFGARETVPAEFADRQFHIHNPQVTLMRTTAAENQQFARWIAAKINRSTAPLEILIPEQGLSMLDAPDQPFYNPTASQALFETLENEVQQTDTRRITRHNFHINDPSFAQALLQAFQSVSNNS